MPLPDISIIVCTWNRCGILNRCLAALDAQSAPPGAFEVIVVDNNSTDATRKVVTEFARNCAADVRYVLETQQGLSAARNCGASEARSEILAFIDDDSIARPEFVGSMIAAFRESSADLVAGMVVSCVSPDAESDLPERFLAEVSFSGVDLGPCRREMRPGEFAVGADMAVRKDLFTKIGGFSHEVGSVGSRKIAGDDTEFFMRASRASAVNVWEPDAVVDHCVLPDRLGKSSQKRSAFDYGVGRVRTTYGAHVAPKDRLAVAVKSIFEIAGCAACLCLTLWSAYWRFKWQMKIGRCSGKLWAVTFGGARSDEQ